MLIDVQARRQPGARMVVETLPSVLYKLGEYSQ